MEFVDRLSSSERDLLTNVINDLIQDASPESLEKIDEALSRVKQRIDSVNHKRNYLGAQVSQTERAIRILNKLNVGDDVIITTLIEMLQSRKYDLRTEVERLKPAEALDRKQRLKRQREKLMARKQFGQLLTRLLERQAKEVTAIDCSAAETKEEEVAKSGS